MLRRLTETDGISGYELPVRTVIQEEIQPLTDTLEIDSMGNLIGFKAGRNGNKTILITAPMDETGLIVTQITEDGYLKFDTVGKIKPGFLVSKRVRVNGYSGVISFKAIHLTTKEERKQPVKIKDLLVDIGASTKKEAESFVLPGDYCVFDSEYVEFGSQTVKAKAAGTRAACCILIDILRQTFDANVIAVFTTQSEIGHRGSETASYRVMHNYRKTDTALILSSIDGNKPEIKLGSGPVLSLHTNDGLLNETLKHQILCIAETNDIPLQVDTTKNNIPIPYDSISAVLSIPCRNGHTAWELIHKSDLEATQQLIKRLIEEG